MTVPRRGVRVLLAAGLTALALVPFAIPDADLPNVPVAAERAVHVAVFAFGAFVWMLALPRWWAGVLIGGLALGAATEVVQDCCVEGRGGEWGDLGADAVGLVVGLALAAGGIAAWRRVRGRRPGRGGAARGPSASAPRR